MGEGGRRGISADGIRKENKRKKEKRNREKREQVHSTTTKIGEKYRQNGRKGSNYLLCLQVEK
jgi:hypothetical protein